jgi:hypothetical protein
MFGAANASAVFVLVCTKTLVDQPAIENTRPPMIRSASLETPETRRLRQEFLNHVRVRPDSVLKSARSLFERSDSAKSKTKSKSLASPAEAIRTPGRLPSPLLADEVQFTVCNSFTAASGRTNAIPERQTNARMSDTSDKVGRASSSRSPAYQGPSSPIHPQIEASGVALRVKVDK